MSSFEEQMNSKENEIKVWKARRQMLSGALRPIAVSQVQREEEAIAKGIDVDEQKQDTGTRDAFIITAATVAISATVLRVGGRAAFVQFLGLDFIMDSGINDQLNGILDQAASLGGLQYAYFFGLWCVAKLFMFDALTVVLALAGGVFFGGVLEGALISTTMATGASFIAFVLARTLLKEKVVEQVEKRPALRAIDRAVSKEGVKTVLTLRLAPVLPIPIGAYNYVYGATTSVSSVDFLIGMFVGSIKPYLLDSYLGAFGKSVMDNTSADALQDTILLLTFTATILVGTLATQVATKTWDELQSETKAEQAGEAGELTWQEMWGIKSSSLPGGEDFWDETVGAAWQRIQFAADEEWDKVLSEAKTPKDQAAPEEQNKDGIMQESIDESLIPPRFSKNNEGKMTFKESLVESSVFTFALIDYALKRQNK